MTKIILVGEAWGAREALFEHAFVGYSGVELAKMLHEAGLGPELHSRPSEYEMIAFWKRMKEDYDIELMNVFNEKPTDNNVELFFTNAKEGNTDLPPLKKGKYLIPEKAYHLESLWHNIEQAKPNIVVAFGNTACWATLGETKISALRGTVKLSPRLGCKVLPTYHPAAVLRQWNLRPIVVTDLEKVSREAESGEVTRVERWLTIEPTLAEIRAWLNRPAEFYAVDIENPHIKIGAQKHYLRGQIAMVGFARTHNDAMVIPFFDENRPGGNYWATPEEEVQAWRLLERALEKPIPKVFQNGVYDLTHLLRLGLRPRMCKDDTMLLHHALYPEMLKGLGFLGSVYSDEIAWKTMAGKGNNLKRDE